MSTRGRPGCRAGSAEDRIPGIGENLQGGITAIIYSIEYIKFEIRVILLCGGGSYIQQSRIRPPWRFLSINQVIIGAAEVDGVGRGKAIHRVDAIRIGATKIKKGRRRDTPKATIDTGPLRSDFYPRKEIEGLK